MTLESNTGHRLSADGVEGMGGAIVPVIRPVGCLVRGLGIIVPNY